MSEGTHFFACSWLTDTVPWKEVLLLRLVLCAKFHRSPIRALKKSFLKFLASGCLKKQNKWD